MTRMIGACLKPRCPACRAASGPDCADASRGKRGQKAHEERQWRREAEDEMGDVIKDILNGVPEEPVEREVVRLDSGEQIKIPTQVVQFWNSYRCWPSDEDLLAAVWPGDVVRFIPHPSTDAHNPCPGALRPYEEFSEEKLRAEHVASLDQPDEDEVIMGVDLNSEWHKRQIRMKALEAASRIEEKSGISEPDGRAFYVVRMALRFERYLRDGN